VKIAEKPTHFVNFAKLFKPKTSVSNFHHKNPEEFNFPNFVNDIFRQTLLPSTGTSVAPL
jgi:hypothetical protein